MNNPVRIRIDMAKALEMTLREISSIASKVNMPRQQIQVIELMRDELVIAIADAEREERQRAELRKGMAQVETQIRPAGSPGQDGSQNSSCASKDLG